MQIVQTVHTGSDTNLWQKHMNMNLLEFWQLTSLHFASLQQSFLPFTSEDGRYRPGSSWHKASVQTDGWRLLFHKLLNNHIDFFLFVCFVFVIEIWPTMPCGMRKIDIFGLKSKHIVTIRCWTAGATVELPDSCCRGQMLSPWLELARSIGKQTGGDYFLQAVK